MRRLAAGSGVMVDNDLLQRAYQDVQRLTAELEQAQLELAEAQAEVAATIEDVRVMEGQCQSYTSIVAELGHTVTGMDRWLASQYAVHHIVNARAELARLREEAVKRHGGWRKER